MDKKITVKEHLIELKKRFLLISISFIILFLLIFLVSTKLIIFIINYYSLELIVIKPLEFIQTQIKLSFYATIILLIPLFLNQIYLFLKPTLFKKIKIVRYYFKSIFLSLFGFLIGFFWISKILLNFFQNIPPQIQTQWTLISTLNFIIVVSVSMALIFQIILIIPLLVKFGILKKNFMKKLRKYIIIVTLIVSEIITPPDPVTLIIFSLPIYLCFEIGSLVSKIKNY